MNRPEVNITHATPTVFDKPTIIYRQRGRVLVCSTQDCEFETGAVYGNMIGVAVHVCEPRKVTSIWLAR